MNRKIYINRTLSDYLVLITTLICSVFSQESISIDSDDLFEYKIQPGDNLWNIAKEYNSSVQHVN